MVEVEKEAILQKHDRGFVWVLCSKWYSSQGHFYDSERKISSEEVSKYQVAGMGFDCIKYLQSTKNTKREGWWSNTIGIFQAWVVGVGLLPGKVP